MKFLPDWAPVNLALSAGGHGDQGTVDHVGIQVDSVETVTAALDRVKGTGLPVREEMGVDCCHANQDKFWGQDPDGVEWEVYHLNYDLEDDDTEEVRRSTAPPVVGTTACCGSSGAQPV
jgi:Glyoxalase/Bleomycin resistance protein/Dioxygenase superfamily